MLLVQIYLFLQQLLRNLSSNLLHKLNLSFQNSNFPLLLGLKKNTFVVLIFFFFHSIVPFYSLYRFKQNKTAAYTFTENNAGQRTNEVFLIQEQPFHIACVFCIWKLGVVFLDMERQMHLC